MKKFWCLVAMITGAVALHEAKAQDQQGQQPQQQQPQQEQPQQGQQQEQGLPGGAWVVVEPRAYMINESCKVLSSADGETWTPSPSNSWRDLDGTFYHIDNSQLYRSLNGVAWEPVKDNQWQDVLGNQYMLTQDCKVVTGNEEGLKVQQQSYKQEPRTAVKQESAPSIAEEKKQYESKINTRLAQLDREIEALKKESKRKNKAEIEAREQSKAKLQTSLKSMNDNGIAGWEELKQEIDGLF